jgi:phenylacetic acid degradation operon negative regulatory protein
LTDDVNGIQTWRPPRLLLTLLGDYWWQRKEHLPSSALVSWLAEFGVSDTAARAALSRLVHNDLLVTFKQGRQTFYKLSERAEHVLNDGGYRIFSFGLCLRSWDGMWSLVAFSIPEENRQLRHVLRDRLRWLGFAPLYDGLWISPHDNLREAANQLAELSISTITMFRAHTMESTPITGLPQQAWDLDALRAQYEKFITMVAPLCERVHEEQFSPEEALLTRTRVMDVWRSFPTMDPDLPDEILPLDWPRARARQLFIETYDALGPLAQRRIQQIIARYAPDLAPMATYHRSDAWLVIEQANKPMPSL